MFVFTHGTSEWSTKGGIGDIALHTKLRWIRADRVALMC